MYSYEITPQLLKIIKEISRVSAELNSLRLSKVVLYEMEKEALSMSSFSSTSIEGNPLPLTEVRKILKNRPQQIRDSEREVLQYNDCLVWLNGLVKANKLKFSNQLIIQAHKKIMTGLLPKVKLGSFRKEPVLVNDVKLRKPIFWPPDYKDVPDLMQQLTQFLLNEKNNVDPLILAGIFHKQFVLIHPFVDGNGRTVRLMTKTLLADLGINTFSLFSFENYYQRNISKYFSMVGEAGDFYDMQSHLDFTKWIIYFCEGILDELYRVQKNIPAQKTSEVVLNSSQKKILKYLESHDTICDQDYAKLTLRANSTRALDFKKLVELGYLSSFGKGPSTYYKLR